MKWLVIIGGFFLPALILLFNAHTMKEQIRALYGLILGRLLLNIMQNHSTPRVKRWQNLF